MGSERAPGYETPVDKVKMNATLLELMIKQMKFQLTPRRSLLEVFEDAERERTTQTLLVDSDITDRFSRAETAAERRMYRALGILMTIRGGELPPTLPPPKKAQSVK